MQPFSVRKLLRNVYLFLVANASIFIYNKFETHHHFSDQLEKKLYSQTHFRYIYPMLVVKHLGKQKPIGKSSNFVLNLIPRHTGIKENVWADSVTRSKLRYSSMSFKNIWMTFKNIWMTFKNRSLTFKNGYVTFRNRRVTQKSVGDFKK